MNNKTDKQQEVLDWLASLNPVVLDIYPDGSIHPDGLDDLKKRIDSEVTDLKTKNEEPKHGHP